MSSYTTRHRQYRQDRTIHVFTLIGFTIVNPNSDSTVFFLHNKDTDDVISIDKTTDKFPADYIIEAILPEGLRMAYFDEIYDLLNNNKTFKKNNLS